MRLAFVVTIAITATATGGIAQDITPDGIARSASLFAAIADYCPSYIQVDPEQARKFLKAYKDIGIKVEGNVAFNARFKNESSRRSKEVDITGALQWCERQQAFLRSKGDKSVFP